MFKRILGSALLIVSGMSFAETNYNCACTAAVCNGNTNTVSITLQDNHSYIVIEGPELILSGTPTRSFWKATGETSLQLGQTVLKLAPNGAVIFNDIWTCSRR